MDAEQLRNTYNNYFSRKRNIWSSEDLKKTRKVARRTIQWLRGFGFSKTPFKLLDVGCATGFYTESFRQLGCDIVGLDYSEVALDKATDKFPHCKFVQMNGFDPHFNEKFDIVFCRGFSGANTHDLAFIAQWINRYMEFITTGGFFIFSYSSNFSGKEKEGEMVNLTMQEIEALTKRINGQYRGIRFFHYFGWISRLKKATEKKVLRKETRETFSVFIQKPSPT
jgi:SAM-dependent methyltransferase